MKKKEVKMKIRNNTDRMLVLYVGNPMNEEPDMIVNLEVGKDIEIPKGLEAEVSIQEK